MTFAAFSAANRLRCERDFGEPLDASSQYTPAHWALTVAEEVGEIAAAVLGVAGLKKRKAHLTVADIGDEIADAVSYLDLLATRLGLDLSTVLVGKFNRVSERIGSDVRIVAATVESADPAMPPPDVVEAMAKACSCCRECQSVPCAGAMAGVCDVAECHCSEESESEEEDFDRNACPGCGGGCQVACR